MSQQSLDKPPLNLSIETIIEAIKNSAPAVPSEPDERSTEEFRELEPVSNQAQEFSIKLQGQAQDIKERKTYAKRFFALGCVWVGAITIILFLQGFGKHLGFNLSDRVLLVALGTTTANVLGVIYVVAKYLFPRR
jgi:hypothetical protein